MINVLVLLAGLDIFAGNLDVDKQLTIVKLLGLACSICFVGAICLVVYGVVVYYMWPSVKNRYIRWRYDRRKNENYIMDYISRELDKKIKG